MATLQELKRYVGYEFSTGVYTGKDYLSFQAKYINYLKTVCKSNNWELVNILRNHYCFSCFIRSKQNKLIYLSISDVRYFTNYWYNRILIRTAKHEKDYTGGINNYTSLNDLEHSIGRLLAYA